jgi:hypothetical protein
MADARDKLTEEPFSYLALKDDRVQLKYHGKVIETLRGHDAIRFLNKAEQASQQQLQLLLAKATKNFKHGNERMGRKK